MAYCPGISKCAPVIDQIPAYPTNNGTNNNDEEHKPIREADSDVSELIG